MPWWDTCWSAAATPAASHTHCNTHAQHRFTAQVVPEVGPRVPIKRLVRFSAMLLQGHCFRSRTQKCERWFKPSWIDETRIPSQPADLKALKVKQGLGCSLLRPSGERRQSSPPAIVLLLRYMHWQQACTIRLKLHAFMTVCCNSSSMWQQGTCVDPRASHSGLPLLCRKGLSRRWSSVSCQTPRWECCSPAAWTRLSWPAWPAGEDRPPCPQRRRLLGGFAGPGTSAG